LGEDPCACGRTLPLLAHLEGRSGESLIGAQGRQLTASALESAFWPALCRTLLYQVEQLAPDRVLWRIVPNASADPESLRAMFLQNGRKYLGDNVTVEVEVVDDLPRTERGKVRSFIVPALGSPR
jgi:phenylacetate-CoA ligase